MKTLVTGGIRSGKSAYAEGLLAEADDAIYLATGPPASEEDTEWQARVAAHQLRRPTGWSTVESLNVADELGAARHPVLLDSAGSWLTAQLDELAAWDCPRQDWQELLAGRIDRFVSAADAATVEVVIVTEEVGLSLVSEHRSGRLYADYLGSLNQQLAAVCDHVMLIVAGCPLAIKRP